MRSHIAQTFQQASNRALAAAWEVSAGTGWGMRLRACGHSGRWARDSLWEVQSADLQHDDRALKGRAHFWELSTKQALFGWEMRSHIRPHGSRFEVRRRSALGEAPGRRCGSSSEKAPQWGVH